MQLTKFVDKLDKIVSGLFPNGQINCSNTELIRIKDIIDTFIECQTNYKMKDTPVLFQKLFNLQEKLDRISKLNQFQRELEHLKNDTEILEQQIIPVSNKSLVQERILKIMATGINLNKFPKLNDYTKEQILGWTRFLNDNKIDLKVCGIDDTCYLMKFYLHSNANLTKTKKTVNVFKDVCLRSERNKRRGNLN